jgi:hypothetical protein
MTFTIVECLKGFSKALCAFGCQIHHLPYVTGALTLASLLQLVGKHLIFFIMMITVVYPVVKPDLRLLYKFHRLKPPDLEHVYIYMDTRYDRQFPHNPQNCCWV